MDTNEKTWDFAIFFIVGVMVLVLGLFIILNPAGIVGWIGYIPIGFGFCFIISALYLFSRRELNV